MYGNAPQPSYAELAALTTELRGEIVWLKARIEELEKKNPTQRFGQSCSVKADEKRRRDADEKKSGKPKTHGSGKDQQASERRGRVPNQDKIDKADALLNQLSRQWEHEFESLCQLLAVSAVVHADETSCPLSFHDSRIHVRQWRQFPHHSIRSLCPPNVPTQCAHGVDTL